MKILVIQPKYENFCSRENLVEIHEIDLNSETF